MAFAGPFANGALVAVDPAQPSQTITVEAAGQGATSGGLVAALQADVQNGQMSNTRARFTPYIKGARIWVVDHDAPAGVPAPRQVSSLAQSAACGGLQLNGNDFRNPAKSWGFFTVPGADGRCNTSDDAYVGVRLEMSPSAAPRSVDRPVARVTDAVGSVSGFVVARGTQIRRVDAELSGALDLFSVSGVGFEPVGVHFGRNLPGIWLFVDNGVLYGYDLGGTASTPTALATLPVGMRVDHAIGDGETGYVLLRSTDLLSPQQSTEVLKVGADLATAITMLSVPEPGGFAYSTPTRLLLRTARSLVSVPKAGGTPTVLAADDGTWSVGAAHTSDETVYVNQYQVGPRRHRVMIIEADGSRRQLLDDAAVVGVAAPPTVTLLNLGRPPLFVNQAQSIHIARGVSDGTGLEFGGSTLITYDGATRAERTTAGVLQNGVRGSVASNTSGAGTLHLGQTGLLTYVNSAGIVDLYLFDSDAAGITRLTSFLLP
jgi:hypothetical protein